MREKKFRTFKRLLDMMLEQIKKAYVLSVLGLGSRDFV
jgi:hypothetical protein